MYIHMKKETEEKHQKSIMFNQNERYKLPLVFLMQPGKLCLIACLQSQRLLLRVWQQSHRVFLPAQSAGKYCKTCRLHDKFHGCRLSGEKDHEFWTKYRLCSHSYLSRQMHMFRLTALIRPHLDFYIPNAK